jgi:regulator of RNase E activity RraA
VREATFRASPRSSVMVGRNFWAVADAEGWVVYEEGLPDRTTRHADREEAWEVANRRAAKLKGEAFLQDADGTLAGRRHYGDFPREIKP